MYPSSCCSANGNSIESGGFAKHAASCPENQSIQNIFEPNK